MNCDNENIYCGCLYYSANALARVITRMAEEEFSIVQLAPSYAFLLMTINGKPGIQPGEISKIMMLKPSTVTRLIEKMEFKMFLERRTVGKFTQVYPTQKSLDLDSQIKKAWGNLLERYNTLMGAEKSRQLTTDIFEATIKLQE
ncbi:MAG: winged helix-turn-helix transcriptional regulator [Deferribacteres bacterium]|nr:winged helix-turn-helix transcriptional regulator [candidate division KSB1 bacterium]MCB9504390.1 winged helix-turn-helix transcriptional regulator [Deferribacteres bacterium]